MIRKKYYRIRILSLNDQAHAFQLPSVLRTGGHDIDSSGIDAAVSQDVCKLRNVLFHCVEGPSEEFAEIVGEYFFRINLCAGAQAFHLCPDIAAVHRVTAAGAKQDPFGDLFLSGKGQQTFSKLSRNEDIPGFSFAPHGNGSNGYRLNCEILEFRYSDSSSTDGFQKQIQPRTSFGCL